MHAVTIQIQYVNPPSPPQPGKKQGPGSIKDTSGVTYKVWGDLLQQFVGREGQTVTINYKTGECQAGPQKGMLEHTVLGIAGTTTGLPPAAPRVQPPVSQGPPPLVPITPAKKEENISVLALVKVYHGQLQVGDRQALVSALRMCRSAWREFQTGDVRPSFKEDFNDEIPKFEDGKDIEDTF